MNRPCTMRAIALLWLLPILVAGCASTSPTSSIHQPEAKPVKVMLITMFRGEAEAWTSRMRFDDEMHVPGLSPDYPALRCTRSGVCLMTTGMGHANAAASTMAVAMSPLLDLRSTYFLINGIAGIDPSVGTIGSATWARFAVDYGIAHEIDAREMPIGWKSGYLGIHAADPTTKPVLEYRTEVFQLSEPLLQMALALTRNAVLIDNDTAKAYRALYAEPAAKSPPSVLQCDTASGDTYWHGRFPGQWASEWIALLTGGQGRYCTTQQEDNATIEALKRGAAAGRLDLGRVAVLRTASNFDRPHPLQSAYESLKARSGGYASSTANLFNVGSIVVNDIVARWERWNEGVPSKLTKDWRYPE